MDFGQILHTAQRNEKSKDQRVRYYSTKFEPPKKEKKSSSQLSENIRKFLAKKDAEEKQKSEEARKKRDDLLALRSQDKKASKRVNVMLKRTKSANQSVLEDAVDNDNTAVTLAGPMQPDEDDYGYVSQEASEYYNKMMEKYSKMPDEPKFDMTKKKVSTNLGNTKDRVKAALVREEEEAKLPHKRKRKHKKNEEDEEGVSYDAPDRTTGDKNGLEKSDKEKMPPPPKPKPKPAPPPINFAELLKIAEKKQFEPVIIEKQEKKEEERLLTKKQRMELEKERELQMRREERRKQLVSSSRIPKMGDKVKQASSTTNSSSKSYEKPSDKPKVVKAANDSGKTSNTSSKEDSVKQVNKEKSAVKSSLNSIKKKKEMEDSFPEESRPGRKYLPGDVRYKPEQNTKPEHIPKQPPQRTSNHKQPETKASQNESFTKKPLSNVSQQYQTKKPSNDMKVPSVPQKKSSMEAQPKRFPPEDVRRKVPQKLPPKQFPPPDVRRSNSKMVPTKRGRILDDDEEEYDSEMDDFIDDDDAGEDISKYISEIFGYDRKRFRDEEDDVDNMETSFAQQMKEEVVSTKLGIMEDLEEERKEEEARRRKLLMKKKMRR